MGRVGPSVCAGVVALACAAGATAATAGSQQGKGIKPPRGYSTVRVAKAGVTMVVPTSWVKVDLTRRSFDAFIRKFRSSDPKGAALLASRHDFLAKSGMFAAFDPRGAPYGGFVTVAATTGGSPFIPTGRPGDIQAAYTQNLGIANTQVSDTSLAGVPAAAVTSTTAAPVGKSRSLTEHDTGYVLATKDGFLQIDFAGRKDPSQDKAVQTMAGSVRLDEVTVPFQIMGSGAQQRNSFHASGPSSLGDTTFEGTYQLQNGQPTPCAQGSGVPATADNTITTANGDIRMSITTTVCQSGSHTSRNLILFDFDSTGTYTIAGGDGCFINVRGSGQAKFHNSFNDPDNATLDATANGTITLMKRPNCPYFQG